MVAELQDTQLVVVLWVALTLASSAIAIFGSGFPHIELTLVLISSFITVEKCSKICVGRV